jgi:hypothetical protein
MVRTDEGRKKIMPQKHCCPEGIIAELREAEALLGQGEGVPEVVKAIGVSEMSYYRWHMD